MGLDLVERDRELAHIEQVLGSVGQGESGLLVLEGPAGIGKTALLTLARQRAAGEPLKVLSARATELERDYPFGVVRQWLEPILRGATATARKRLLDGAAGLAEAAVNPDGDMPPAAGSPAVLHGIYWLFANLAAVEPLVLLLDDAHWADEPSLRLLNHLIPRMLGMPLGLIVTCRPPGLDEEGELLSRLLAEPGVPTIRPGVLTIGGAARLLEHAFGQSPEPEFVECAHAATGGNPFYLHELARELLEQGASGTTADAGRIAAAAPRSLSRAILTRISPAARALARSLAVLDEPAELDVAAAVAAIDPDAAIVASEELVRVGVIADRRPVELIHAIVRSAVIAGMSAAERHIWHRRAAAVLQDHGAGAERLALHLLATEPNADAEVAATLRRAADSALARGAPQVAARLLRRALAEPPAAAAREAIVLALGDAEQQANKPVQAAAHLRELFQSSTDALTRGEALRRLPLAIGPNPDLIREIVPQLDRTIPEVSPLNNELALRLQAMRLGVSTMLPGEGADRDLRLASFVEMRGTTPGECALLGMIARALMDSGRPAEEVLAVAERAIANPAALEEEGPGSIFVDNCCTALRQAERFDLLDPFLDRALALARRRGSVLGFVLVSAWRSLSARRQGLLRDAEADARAAGDAGGSEGPFRVATFRALIEALVDQGKLDEARTVDHALGVGEQVPAERPHTAYLITRGALRHATGDRQRALADLREALARTNRYTTSTPAGMDARVRLVSVLRELDRSEEARLEAESALAVARSWGTPGIFGMALRAHANLAPGNARLAQLREAVGLLASSPLRLEHAEALIDLGAALRRAGRRADSRPPLRQGLGLAERSGAAPLAQRARDELAASGTRVPRQRLGDQLTPSEQRIVDMAAQGHANPQIAQALFITTKTVESHLANAYRKLGVSSRRELTPTPSIQDRSMPAS